MIRRALNCGLFFMLIVSPVHADVTNGLVGWWKFDEAAGNAIDSSGQGNTGTPTGTTIMTSGCKRGNCRSFNGSSEYIDVGTSGTLAVTRFTIAFWMNAVNAADTGAIEQVINRGSQATYSFSWRHASAAFVKTMAFYDGGWRSVQINGTMNTGTWYHVVSTYDGNNLRIFLQGNLDNTTVYAGTPNIPVQSLTIGSQGASTYFNGSIDDVRIYNRALTETEIKAIYLSGNPQISVKGGGKITGMKMN